MEDVEEQEEEEDPLLPQGRGMPAGGATAVWFPFPDWPTEPGRWFGPPPQDWVLCDWAGLLAGPWSQREDPELLWLLLLLKAAEDI